MPDRAAEKPTNQILYCLKQKTPLLKNIEEEIFCCEWLSQDPQTNPILETKEVQLDTLPNGTLACGYSLCRHEIPQG